jgi:hypothetical protein
MTLSRDEAQMTLRDISKTERRSSSLFGYRFGAPHLFLWGAIWMVAYGASYIRPEWSIVWPVLVVVGSIGSFWLGWRVKSARTDTFGLALRSDIRRSDSIHQRHLRDHAAAD